MDQKSLGDWTQSDLDRYAALSAEEKRKQLFHRQLALLDQFLERNAITQAQYDKSLSDLCEKMGMDKD